MSIKKGIYAASMTIISKKDLSVDVDSTIKHSEKLIQDGCHGCVMFGSTGQAQLISSNEKKKVIEKLSDSKFKDHFILGTGVNSLNENVELIRFSVNNGINRFLLGVPAYYEFGDEGAYSFFANLIQKIPEIEIILYNFEKLFRYKFSAEVVERLVKDFSKQCLGLKDSSYNLYSTLKIDKDFLIFPGSETKLLKGLELGCSGIISAVCNVAAPLARKVYDDFHDKKKQTVNERLCAVRQAFDKYNLISAIHAFLSVENPKFNRILPPLGILGENEKKDLLTSLKKLDFFPAKNLAA